MPAVLVDFIKDARHAGKTTAEIREVLADSGWSREQVDESLAHFVDRDFPVAIPRPVVFASPRLAFMNLFHFVCLYMSCLTLIFLLFTLLDYYLPDGLGRQAGIFYSSYRPLFDSIRGYLSVILVSVPLTIWTHLQLGQAMREAKQRVPRIRLILIGCTMFIGACVMLGNFTCLVNYLLNGELGIRFLIKVGILTGMFAAIRAFYRIEVKHTEVLA